MAENSCRRDKTAEKQLHRLSAKGGRSRRDRAAYNNIQPPAKPSRLTARKKRGPEMENYFLLAAEYGFFIKMSGVVLVILVAGFLLRKRSSPSRGRADPAT